MFKCTAIPLHFHVVPSTTEANNSPCLNVLLSLCISTSYPPQLKHFWYCRTNSSVPCWYQSVSCVSSHRVKTANHFAVIFKCLVLNILLQPCKQVTIARRRISLIYSQSVCVFENTGHAKLLSELPSQFIIC